MFRVTITNEKTGKQEVDLSVDSYLFLGQAGVQFTKSFSTPDLVTQLGLLEFAKQNLIKKELEATKG